jgi:hypothetical protein
MRGRDGFVKEEARFLEKRGALSPPSHQAIRLTINLASACRWVDERLEMSYLWREQL